MKFIPNYDYVEVEPIESKGALKDDSGVCVGIAKSVGRYAYTATEYIDDGDIIFFRPHGFFELSDYGGKKRYVVNIKPEFVLGVLKNDVPTE